MNITKVHLLAALAIIQAVIIVGLIASRSHLVLKVIRAPVAAKDSPLRQALEYESPDEKFEELAKKYPEWISYRSDDPGSANSSILEDCALLKRTNYVRILIAHGADVEQAVKGLKQAGADEAINLLRRAQSQKGFSP